LLTVKAPYDPPTYTYTQLVLHPQPYSNKKGSELTASNGQPFRVEFKERQTKVWKFSTDYHGLHLSFALVGDQDDPPLQEAARLVDILKDQEFFVPIATEK
jgi:hypothetical protein